MRAIAFLVLAACAASVPPPSSQSLEAAELKKAPKSHNLNAPPIPPDLLRSLRGKKGVIYVRLWVSDSGTVDDVEIIKSTLPELDALFVAHLKHATFEPYLVDGVAKRFKFTQPFVFNFDAPP